MDADPRLVASLRTLGQAYGPEEVVRVARALATLAEVEGLLGRDASVVPTPTPALPAKPAVTVPRAVEPHPAFRSR